MVFEVYCEWDPEAGVWYVTESNVPGLVAEAPTLEGMEALLQQRVPELLQANQPDRCDDVPMELLVKSQRKSEIHC